MGTTPTSRRGATEGYVLLDALLAMVLAALIAAAILPGIAAASRRSEANLERARAGLAERSDHARAFK